MENLKSIMLIVSGLVNIIISVVLIKNLDCIVLKELETKKEKEKMEDMDNKMILSHRDWEKLYSFSLRGEILSKKLKNYMKEWENNNNIDKYAILSVIKGALLDTDKIIEEFKEVENND